MVDILEQSGALKPKAPLANLPASTESEAQIAAPGVELGRALRGVGSAFDALSEKLDASSIPEAQAAGLAAVGRDEKGNPTFEPRMFALSGADRAYNAAGRQGSLSAWQTSMQSGLHELAQTHFTDPAGFQAAARTYVRETTKGAGADILPLARAEGDKLAQQFMLSISNRKFTVDTENAKTSITTQIEDKQNALFAMAKRGGIETPEGVEIMTQIRGLYEDLGKNPAYGYPAARVESEIERVRSQARGEAIVGEVDRTYTRTGKAAAQRYLTDNILNNDKLNLSSAQRAQFYNSGLARLQFLDGETKAQVDAHRSTVNTIVTGLQSRVQIPDGQIDDAIGKAQKLGDAESVLKLTAARSIAILRRDTGLTDEQEVKLFAGIGSGPAVPAATGSVQARIYSRLLQGGLSPVMAFGLMGNLAMESSFNTSARNPGDGRDGTDSIGIAQWNSDRARALAAFAAQRGKPVTDIEMQADFIVHELSTTEGRARIALETARTPEEAGRAAIGYFRPAGFSWANPDGAHNSGQRIEQARLLASSLGGALPEAARATARQPFTAEQLQANPFLGSIWIQSQVADQKEMVATASRLADAISGGIDKGLLPDPQSFAAFLQLADQFPDQLGRTRDSLVAKAQGHDDAQNALGQPSTAGAQLVRDAMAQAQGAPILVQQRAQAMKEAWERGVKSLQTEPWEEAERRGWAPGIPRPLDFSSVDIVRAGLDARFGVAKSISSRTGESQSVLSPRDLSAVTSVWATGAPIARQNLANGLAALPPEQFGMVMAEKEMRDSLIGMSRSGDPAKMATAFSLMDKEQRRDPDGFSKLYGRDVENRMATWMVRSQYMPADQLAKEEARYNDPAMQKARETLRETAMTATKKLTAGDIAGYVGGSWVPFAGADVPTTPAQSQRLVAEFREEYAATFAEVGDATKARELAVQRIGRVWGVSPLNNGTLMRFPPERAYQTLNGSHAWLAKQLDDDIRQSFAPTATPVSEWDLRPPAAPSAGAASERGRPSVTERRRAAEAKAAMTPEQRAEVARVEAMISAPRMLVPDARTEAEFNAGQPPSYPIVLKAPNGMFVPLQDEQGRQLRFRGDIEAALAPMRERAGASWREMQTEWRANDATYDRLTADAQRKRAARLARREAQQ